MGLVRENKIENLKKKKYWTNIPGNLENGTNLMENIEKKKVSGNTDSLILKIWNLRGKESRKNYHI